MKKSMIILGSVIGVGAAAGAGTLIYFLTKPFKADQSSTTMITMQNTNVNLLTTSRTAGLIDKENFEDAITANKDKLQTYAEQVKSHQKLNLEIHYKDSHIRFDFKMKQTGSKSHPKFKVIINKVDLYRNSDDKSFFDAEIKGTKISAFKAYARKYIYALWKLEKDKDPNQSLADIKAAITATTDLDADVTPIA